MSYLVFDAVSKRFPVNGEQAEVIAPFDLSIAKGEIVVFLGPSGCGKTTLMRMVGGLEVPTAGAIRLNGSALGKPDRRRGMVFQSYSSFPWLNVAENVEFGMRYRTDMTAAGKRERTRHYLDIVGLSDFATSYPSRNVRLG